MTTVASISWSYGVLMLTCLRLNFQECATLSENTSVRPQWATVASREAVKVASQYLNVISLLAVLKEINREGHMCGRSSYNHINIYIPT